MRGLALALVLAAQAACASILGLEAGTPRDDAEPPENVDREGGTKPTASDPDGSVDNAKYAAFDDLSKWAAFDLKAVNPEFNGFYGGGFDGKRLYFTQQRINSSVMAIHDPSDPFDAGASWRAFNFTDVDPLARGYVGGVRAGDRMFFPPHVRQTGALAQAQGIVIRHEPSETFDGGWSAFDIGAQVDPEAVGMFGGAFDGTHVYFAPYALGATPTFVCNSTVARYDTRAPYGSPQSWLTFDLLSAFGGNACGFQGAIFDGRSLYLIPFRLSTLVRYDTAASFVVNTSWTGFDLGTLNEAAHDFTGGVFDGRYLYLVPGNTGATPALALRYDTQTSFDAGTGGWVVFPMSQLSPLANGFAGGAFDGRYVYFVPERHGLFVRYDTRAPFDDPKSWSTFGLDKLNVPEHVPGTGGVVSNFRGAIFDGKSVYFVPQMGVVVRFDAKDPPGLPSFHPGSFL